MPHVRRVQSAPRGSDGSVKAQRPATVSQTLRERACRIAYFGASVTEQREGFRPRLHQCLTERCAQGHRAINAGIGGVGSVTGVFLMEQLVLAHRPDLCVIEFTTGDSGSDANVRRLGAAAEGILRKLHSIQCAAIVVHGYRGDDSGGRHREAMRIWDLLASHYGVPSIDLHGFVAAQGIETRERWYRDGIHTTPEGAQHVAAWTCAAILGLGAGDGGPREVTALRSDHLERTQLVPVVPEMASQPARCSGGTYRFVYPWTGLEPGNPIRVEVEGDVVGLLVVAGPDSGVLHITTEHGSERIVAFDQWCHYDRLSSVILGSDWPIRRVSVEVSGEPVDRSIARRPVSDATCTESRLRAIAWMVRMGSAPAANGSRGMIP